MSCVTFLSNAQRAALAAEQPRLSLEEIAAMHPVPEVTAGKLHRLRVMASSEDPKIRESAALNIHAPRELLATLAADPEMGVRCCVARAANAGEDILAALALDDEPLVRGWVAGNAATPTDVLDELADDPDPQVRKIRAWAAGWNRD